MQNKIRALTVSLLFQLCLFFSLQTSAIAEMPCKQHIKLLISETQALASIAEHFQHLQSGDIANDFSLTAIFSTDLLSNEAANNRVNELKTTINQPTTAAPHCSSSAFKEALTNRNTLLNNISATRLKYLQLNRDQRHYLMTLVSRYKAFTTNQANLKQSLNTTNEKSEAFNTQLSQLEQAFQAQKDPEQRTILFSKISTLKNSVQALESQQVTLNHQHTVISQLVNFTQQLLIDYNNLYIKRNDTTNASAATFNAMISPDNIAAFFRRLEGNEPTAEQMADKAALLIIHSRIYGIKRKHQSTFAKEHYRNDNFSKTLEHELKTLLALGVANLHLKLFNTQTGYSYLSKSAPEMLTNVAFQIIVLLLFLYFMKKAPEWINAWQRYLIRHHLNKKFSRQLIATLRVIQPNTAWLSAIGLYYMLDNLPQASLRDLILLYDITAIIAFYYFINTITTWSIGNTNSKAHLFVLRSKQQAIIKHCGRFSFYITLSSVLYIVLDNILNGGIICNIYKAFLIAIIWLASYRLINHFQSEFEIHLSKRISEQTLKRFQSLQKPMIKDLINPIVFLALQTTDILIAIHNRLLRFESYQKLTAKFLKIRLEQTQSLNEASEKDEQDDVHYENWFLNKKLIKAHPNLLINTQWIKEINQRTTDWLEEKQDENDVAIIGESGMGKSTLVKQWLNQWDKSKTVYIKVPAKTTTEKSIFNLIKEALTLDINLDIAQFVIAQQSIAKTVIVIDKAHHLFVSDVGGFDAYKMLQNLISAKLNNIYWVIVINKQSWIYLNDVFSRTYQFSNILSVNRWSQQDIRDLMLKRHRASKRQLTYDDLLLASTSHNETAARAAEARCFSLLWDQSAGIPAIALAIWMNTARNPAKGKVVMGIPERPANDTLINLSDDHLFVYAALVIHETLNTQQAQAVTHLPEAIVRRALKFGLDQGFLIRKSMGRYLINPLWYLQLYHLLKRKNFLHE